MQEDNFDLFDDRVRSLLDGAEVKAPRGVWRAVRGSLDAAASWWRWAACGMVAASLLAGGLFLGGVFDRSAQIVESPVLAQVEVSDPVPGVEQVAEPDPAPAVPAIRHAAPVPAAPAIRHTASGPAASEASAGERDLLAQAAEPVREDESVMEKEAASDAGRSDVQPSSAELSDSGQWSDPFARMALEDRLAARGKSRVSLALLGIAGGNDSDLGTYLGRTARMADASGAATRTGITEQSASAYGIPVSVGLGIRYNFNKRLSLGTGLTWSMLHRTFTGEYNEVSSGAVTSSVQGDVDHTMHYVGIPLNLYFNAVNTGNIKVYAFGGGSAEYCVSNRYLLHGGQKQVSCSEAVKGLQYSVSAGLGVEFGLTDNLGVYFDPSARYYPKSDHPRSVRTDKPFMVNFEAGLRLNL